MLNPLSIFKSLKLAGSGYVALNTLRVLTIISLGVIIAASWIMIVRTVQNTEFFFFDSVSHFMTSTISIFLIVSELCLFKDWFRRNWPLLSERSGLITLSLALIMLGCQMLGQLNKTATSAENIGLPFWRVILGGGILGFVSGFLNLVCHFLFRMPGKGITSRMIRAHGAKVLLNKRQESIYSDGGKSPLRSFSLPTHNRNTENRESRFNFKGFNVREALRRSIISRPVPTNTEQFDQFNGRSHPISPTAGLQRPAPTFGRHPAYTESVYSRDSKVF